MPTTYTSLIGLALPATGELAGTWGATVNDSITSLLDTAVAGTTTLNTDADVTLSTTTGAANQARQAIILWTANGTVTRNITAPASSKTYVVINASASTQSIVIRGAGPTTGVTVLKGERVTVAWNGSDFVKVGGFGGSGTFNDVTITTGNLNFSGTAQRITGDMSNATVANRLTFQTSTVNGNTVVQAVPNGTSVVAAYRAFSTADPTNSSFIEFRTSADSGRINSDATGTGTYLPMTFFTGGSERVRVDTSGNVGIGLTPNSGQGTLQSFRSVAGGAPVTSGSSDANQAAMFAAGSVQLSYGATAAGAGWLQMRSSANFAVNYDLLFNPNGGNVGIGTSNPGATGIAPFLAIGANNTGIGSASANILAIVTNNTERMRFLAGGGITSEDRADAVGYKGTPINEQSAAYTLVMADQGKTIVHPITDNNARTFTIPANGTVAYPVGTTITFINMINTLTIAITTDTMYLAGAGTTGSRTLAAYGMATAVKITSTSWIISGNGLT